MILAIRTDKPQSELYLFDNNIQADTCVWLADRKLADELLPHIQELLKLNNTKLEDLKAIIIYTGTGSFTGLRIGTTVANTLAYSFAIPIVEATGEDWLADGLQKLKGAKAGDYVVPKYSSPPNITKPKNSF